VNLHQTDVVASHTLILPKANKLIHSLRVTGEIILRLTRKRTSLIPLSPKLVMLGLVARAWFSLVDFELQLVGLNLIGTKAIQHQL
jgi:hypothetical protein